jgi:coatomer protein complex subunit alpha (xenin)
LDIPIYITAVRGNKIHCLDRDIRNRSITIDTTEFSFKQALINNNFNEVMKMVRNSKLMGQAIISYLQKKGHPEIALHFVQDEKTRFNLALECGNIDIALDAAKKLDDKDIWQRLGEEALRQGNHQVVELAYQKTKNFERLSFLYLITGNVDNLRTMAKIAQKRNDVMGRFQTALLLGDVAERIKVLEETGQVQLAYMTARSHGLEEEAARLWDKIQRVQQKKLASEGVENADQQVIAPPTIDLSRSKLLFPAVPILKLADSNWPLLTVTKGPYDVSFRPAPAARGPTTTEAPKTTVGRYQEDIDVAEASGWGDDLDVALDGNEGKPTEPEETVGGGEPDLGGGDEAAWGGDELSDMLSDIKISTGPSTKGRSNAVAVFPNEGMTAAQAWTMASQLPGDHASAGGMGIAQLLSSQIGAVNFAPFTTHVSTSYRATRTWLPLSPGSSPICTYGPRRTDDGPRSLPLTIHDISSLTSKLQLGYKATTGAKLPEAIGYFESILAEVPFVVVSTRAEAQEVKELVSICREYLVGLKCEMKRKELLAKEQESKCLLLVSILSTNCVLKMPSELPNLLLTSLTAT